MIDYTKILLKHFDAQWTLNGDDYEGLSWLSDSPKPTKEELDSLWPEVKAELEAEKTQEKTKKQALLDRLGITADEAKLLLS